jgi:hypothetical protein
MEYLKSMEWYMMAYWAGVALCVISVPRAFKFKHIMAGFWIGLLWPFLVPFILLRRK